jgi:uncharacterized protein YoxC
MFIIFVFNICIYMVLQDIDKKVKMVRKKLSALTTGVQTCTIKVKVIRLWESINNKTDELRYDFY